MQDLKAVAAKLVDLDQARNKYVEHRNHLVVDAYHAGTPIAHIARDAGLTRARVYTIIDQSKEK